MWLVNYPIYAPTFGKDPVEFDGGQRQNRTADTRIFSPNTENWVIDFVNKKSADTHYKRCTMVNKGVLRYEDLTRYKRQPNNLNYCNSS
jgi:hypothetical protein